MREITLNELKEMAIDAKGEINMLFLHWSAGHYSQFFDDYHVNIDYDGKLYVSCESLSELKSHTWHHNSGAVGISLACCVGATSEDLGEEPPTKEQIEAMSQVVAVLSKYLELPCDYDHVRTHGEQGDEEPDPDKYGQNTTCERWDLAILATGDEWGSGGNTIRGKANWYLANTEM